ncbi:YceI family protein [Sphingomonas cannabina]|uniref:YceI family protein n=1 Tax=Sphingomonas cannabina TaxID=2899123 RepID=UPI001F27EF87|nr:YceI family protein [Sphingomonas cannabina]UIJ44058.1 YceI family protein [Sphingomonas cannabina]
MRRIVLASVIATVAVAAPIVAQQGMQAPGSKNPAAITGGTYQVDPGHTLVRWQVDHLGFTPYFGIFGSAAGTLTLDPKNPGAAKVDVTIPVAKVTTANEALTAHLLRPGKDGGKPDFFGPSPADARFVSTSVMVNGQSATIAGNLTLNGVTKPVTLAAEFYGAGKMPEQMGGKENVGFTATGTIKRSDFGVTMGIPLVSDEVKLDIAAAFAK